MKNRQGYTVPFNRAHCSLQCTVHCTIALLVFFLTSTVFAQGGLKEIPSTKVEDQKAGFKLPQGAVINLYAAEPLIKKPVHMNWDSKGRLWVVSSPLYPHIKPGQEEIDKVVILEDTNGDGTADKSTTFADELHIPTAVLPGDGGAYVANSTEMLYLRDTDGDGKADHRRIVLSGFGTEDTHHLIHTFRWGPEGMIWMNQSIYIHTHLETPYGIRRLLGGGMWHFRPETQRAEVYMKGLINPWGHVFDKWGQSFMTDGAGSDGVNFVFPRSVFRTSPGASRVLPGLNPGQPKHCGAEVLSGKNLPDSYQGTIAAPDFRGHRINRFKLTENGTSGYTSTQVEDLISCTHRAFRPIDVKMGPDGAIYVADWYNPIIQHGEVDFRDERRDHERGRIWRISFPDRPKDKLPNYSKMSEEQLAELAGPVGWANQMATVELRNRDPRKALAGIKSAWKKHANESDDRLRDLYLVQASQAINQFQEDWAIELFKNAGEPRTRAGALRALYYQADNIDEAKEIAERAVNDPHPRVRLFGVSVLSQLYYPETVQIALRALEGIDHPDEFLDFAVWNICREHSHKWMPIADNKNPFETPRQLLYAMRAANTHKGSKVILNAFENGEFKSDEEISDVADWISRSGDSAALDLLLAKALKTQTSASQRATMLTALVNAMKLRKITPSKRLGRVDQFLKSEDPEIFKHAAALTGLWKNENARSVLEKEFLGNNQARSIAALEGLRLLGGAGTGAFLSNLAKHESTPQHIKSRAIIGFSRFNPAAAARLAAVTLPMLDDPRAVEAVFGAFLANNHATVHLTNALNGGAKLPESIALIGMQKASSSATHPQGLIKAIQKAGGLKPMKMALTEAEMDEMQLAVAKKGDAHRGEQVYRREALRCLTCHAIGGAGGVVGPDLVSIGSSAPVDYLIESMLEPSKKIKEGYHTNLITMKNGDTFAGAIAKEDNNEIVIRDAAGNENRLAKSEVKSKTISPISLMPPGLTLQLREDEFVDLIRFLSELGKEGAFKTKPTPFVRNWEVLHPHDRTRDDIGHYGQKIFAEDFKGYQWSNFYAKVNGSVPVTEMPDVRGRGRNRYGVARFQINSNGSEELKLRIEGKINDLNLFLNEEEIQLPKDQKAAVVNLKVKPGEHRVTFSGLKGWGLDDFRVEILERGSITLTNR